MPTSHTYEQKMIVPVAITDPGLKYFDARNQAATAEEFKGLTLTNMPRLIGLLKDEKIAKAIRESFADTISGEYHTTIKGDRVYAVAHSNHPLIAVKRLKEGIKKQDQYGFMPLYANEAKILFKDMISIVDVKSGYDASNQTIAINLDKDNPVINPRGQLAYDIWMKDDRILAACGSEDNREFLGEFLFKKEKKRDNVGNYHRIHERLFDQSAGRLVVLGSGSNGVIGDGDLDYGGRFVGVAPEALDAHANSHNDLLEHRVRQSDKTGKVFEWNGRLYAPISGAKSE